jgi:hypothetical protein
MQIPAQIAVSQSGVHLQSRPQVQQLGKNLLHHVSLGKLSSMVAIFYHHKD